MGNSLNNIVTIVAHLQAERAWLAMGKYTGGKSALDFRCLFANTNNNTIYTKGV
jgi:hypothetical protein